MLYLKWKNNSLKRVFDIRQSFGNGGKCERSCPFPDAHECVSKCVGMPATSGKHSDTFRHAFVKIIMHGCHFSNVNSTSSTVKSSHDPRSYERNLRNFSEKPDHEKLRASTEFELVTSRLCRYETLTNEAMKRHMMRAGHLVFQIFP